MDVICLGELLVDMFPAELGKKLAEVSAFRPKPGGAPANVAVALARLGVRSAFVGKVGDDAFGHHLVNTLTKEGVETQGIRYDAQARTTMAFIANPDPHTAEFLFYRNPGPDTRLRVDELDQELLRQAKALHFGSLSLAEEPIRSATREAVQIVREAGGLISFDVNFRPSLWSSPEAAYQQVMELLPMINLLKVNEVELQLLTGQDDPKAGSQQLLQEGPDSCVITKGAEGSYFRVEGGFDFIPAFQVETIDATGCGDAFIAGLLSRLISNVEWPDLLRPDLMRKNLYYANAVGALTAQTQGVIPALPTVDAVASFLSQKPEWRELNARN